MSDTFTKREVALLSKYIKDGYSLDNAIILLRGNPAAAVPAQETRPAAFLAWAVDMFGPVAKLRSERLLRFIEEAIELAHAEGMERGVLNLVADRVYSRPAGDTPKEIGQAQACLETFAENIGLSSANEAQREWGRVQGIPREEWSRRHSAKQAIGIALPSTEPATPAAKWREEGKPDPHDNRYDCERAKLAHGNMTDDEIANAVFLNNNDIGILTAAKDRIRWLSRALAAVPRPERGSIENS